MNEQRDMVYAILAIQKEQQSTADNNKRERRSPSPLNKSTALPAARDTKRISPVISEDESIFASIATTSRNSPHAFKPSILTAMPSQNLHVQHGAVSFERNQSSTHQDEVDHVSRSVEKQIASRSLVDKSWFTPVSPTAIETTEHDTTRQVLRSFLCLVLASSSKPLQIESFIVPFAGA